MNRAIVLTFLTLPVFVACNTMNNAPYKPADKSETTEFNRDVLDAYPGDVRSNLDTYAGVGVAWAGIIQDTAVETGKDGVIHATTTLDHHYFDWQQNNSLDGAMLNVSPRGEGAFRINWDMTLNDEDTTARDAAAYAAPGKLAIVYGVPQSVDNGTVVLRYRYLRVVDNDHYT